MTASRPPCTRCSHRAEKDPTVDVQPAEVLEGLGGRVYFAGLCRECNDVEWSQRWAARYAQATTEADERRLRKLEHAKTARIASGRRVMA